MSFKMPKARQLSSGSWRCQVERNGVRKSYVKNTEEEAVRAALAFIMQEAPDAEVKVNALKRLTLEDAANAYIQKRSNVLSPSTIRGYRTIIKTRFQSVMRRPLSSQRDWQAVINAEAKLCSAKTLKNAWGFIQSVLRDVGIDPGKVLLPQVIEKDIAFLEPNQVLTFIDAVKGAKHEIVFLLAVHGLRRSEIIHLRKEDIKDGIIHVRGATVMDENGKYLSKDTNKNATSSRDVPIVINRLNDLIAQSPDGILDDTDPTSMYKQINRICRINNLPEVGFHGLRHSFASLCYHLKLSEAVCMQLGGWSNPATMRKIYTHLAKVDQENAVKNLKKFFGKAV